METWRGRNRSTAAGYSKSVKLYCLLLIAVVTVDLCLVAQCACSNARQWLRRAEDAVGSTLCTDVDGTPTADSAASGTSVRDLRTSRRTTSARIRSYTRLVLRLYIYIYIYIYIYTRLFQIVFNMSYRFYFRSLVGSNSLILLMCPVEQ